MGAGPGRWRCGGLRFGRDRRRRVCRGEDGFAQRRDCERRGAAGVGAVPRGCFGDWCEHAWPTDALAVGGVKCLGESDERFDKNSAREAYLSICDKELSHELRLAYIEW